MGDLSGIIFTSLLFLIIIFNSTFKKNKISFRFILLGFALHIAISIYNGFIGPTIGADMDSLSFYEDGMRIASSGDFQFSLGSDSYRNILGVLFYLFGPSMYLACILSVAAYVFSLFPLIYIINLLKFSRYQAYIIASYSLLPSMFLFGSVALRESLEISFFIFAVKYFLQFYVRKNISYFFLAILFTFMMGILHFGLLFFGVIMVVIVLLLNHNRTEKSIWVSKTKITSYCILAVLSTLIIISQDNLGNLGFVSNIIQGESLTDYTEMRRNISIDQNARSGYEINIDFSSPIGLIVSLVTMFVYYIAYPFPWKISTAADVYAFIEVSWRCLLIYYSIKGWFFARGDVKRFLFLLLLLYFSLAAIWSFGTNNFGTGMRHHTTNYWILTITGLPYLILYWGIFFKSLISKTPSPPSMKREL